MENRASREKISLDPVALIGLIVTLVTVTVGATWFIAQRIESSEILLLKNQVGILENQIKILNQEVQEKTDVLQQISIAVKNNQKLTDIINKTLKERIGILGPRDVWINEAVLLPETNITIAYENFSHYSYFTKFFSIINLSPFLWIKRFIFLPDILTISSDKEFIMTNLFPRAGAEVQFQYKDDKYKLFILAVRENNVRISVFKDINKN